MERKPKGAMTKRIKVGSNDPCPCGSGNKYKRCCRGKVEWETILRGEPTDITRLLSARGRNLLFLERVAGALQLNSINPPNSLSEFKRAFTPHAVEEIYSAIPDLWPDGSDLEQVLKREANTTSGLYVGTYDPDIIQRGVTRHSLYADSILLIDPLVDPRRIRPEYNPLVNPAQHRSTALRWITLWLRMAPWIEAGLVKFIRLPTDFDPTMEKEAVESSLQRLETHPELEQLMDAEAGNPHLESYKQQVLLGTPDTEVERRLREREIHTTEEEIAAVLAYIQQQRDAHPYFIEPLDESGSELLQLSTGGNYEMAKATALMSGSYLFTDLSVRWREIEIDRGTSGIDPHEWSAFAKAFHALPFGYLNNVPLDAALRLRQEERLVQMRSFLRKIWKSAAPEQSFSSRAVADLAAELEEKVREAEVEWNSIDRELIKWFGAEFAAGAVGLGPAVVMGGAEWAAAAVVAAGIGNLVHAGLQRRDWTLKHPAAFFLRLESIQR
jgi:hypothetical protein